MLEIFKNYIVEIAALGTTISAYFFGKRKQNAEVKTAEGNALSQMQETYNEFVKDFQEKYAELKKDFDKIKEEVHLYEKKYIILKRDFENCKKKIAQ